VDQIPLVNEQIRDGKRLLERCREAGFPVTAAGWIRETDGYRWHLYIASPVVEEEGIDAAHGRIDALIRQMPQPFSIEALFEVVILDPHQPFAKAMRDLKCRHPGKSYFHFGGSTIGVDEVEAMYVYLPAAGEQQKDGQAAGAKDR
jgi:hypothetical protein